MERVHFVGQITYPNFSKLLQLSTVHMYLNYPFVLSWSLLEAMIVGCAIVASDTTRLREAISHNKTGVLVDFFDEENLAKQTIPLLQTLTERQRLGTAAREFSVVNYDFCSVCLQKQRAWVDALMATKEPAARIRRSCNPTVLKKFVGLASLA